MPINEINELIAQLLTLFWSAAAGNIQLCNTTLKSGSTATLTDEATPGSNPDMQTSSSELSTTAADSGDQTPGGRTVKSSVSEDMIVVHDMDTLLDTTTDEFPKVSLLDSATATLSQTSTATTSSSLRKEVKFFLPEHGRLSTGSNMSTGSVESSNTTSTVNQLSPQHASGRGGSGGDGETLQSGCCIRQKKEIKVKDVKIAAKAIEIISCFVQYRKGKRLVFLI